MDKRMFAKALKMKQRKLGAVPENIINSLSDNDIINSYRICADCGELFWSWDDLDNVVVMFDDADKILDELGKRGGNNHEG